MTCSKMTDSGWPAALAWALIAGAALAISGCGAAKQMQAPAPGPASLESAAEPRLDLSQIDTWATELSASDQQLGEALAADGTMRCEQAVELRDRICELAERICDIADRHPQRPDLRDRCADGTMRCARARQVVAERCE